MEEQRRIWYISEAKIVIDEPNYMFANTNGPAKLPNSLSDSEYKLALSRCWAIGSNCLYCSAFLFCWLETNEGFA